jgi:hypothetical protein
MARPVLVEEVLVAEVREADPLWRQMGNRVLPMCHSAHKCLVHQRLEEINKFLVPNPRRTKVVVK